MNLFTKKILSPRREVKAKVLCKSKRYFITYKTTVIVCVFLMNFSVFYI